MRAGREGLALALAKNHPLTQERPQPAARWFHGSLRIASSTTRGQALAPFALAAGAFVQALAVKLEAEEDWA